ncbi:DUF3168 domain-containing protein [Agrobacterium vitis]|uniref:DUF3168 domain-containing protein n=1 Tax=Agrobacterium vitis TaxID=373 RepID=A0A368NU49_AGRVI|nr:DUF3168 domain-containing protein [Agrobacterium vitis]KAA3519642.1 DUF3168 domain-containing protein [Agrobacterium vitis]KAA3532146.1 DUF3168 domain-containing protein [Agrobacterium vitis]MCF1475785.1 DUF3168 domain-containing protein [Agrobacterium vitis]MUZ94980.1 DUF3168 domain-containing protein [Agrobacterium vitis]MVA29447.1 DUF3168 domain-containing protein [Agrobacterium vitis]
MTTHSPVNDLLTAMTAAALADTGIAAIIGADGMKDRRLLRSAQPYLMVGEVTVTDLSTDDDGLVEALVSLQAWSSLSRREAESLAAMVRAVLQDAALPLAHARLIALRHIKTVSRREAKTGLYLAELQFRAVIA